VLPIVYSRWIKIIVSCNPRGVFFSSKWPISTTADTRRLHRSADLTAGICPCRTADPTLDRSWGGGATATSGRRDEVLVISLRRYVDESYWYRDAGRRRSQRPALPPHYWHDKLHFLSKDNSDRAQAYYLPDRPHCLSPGSPGVAEMDSRHEKSLRRAAYCPVWAPRSKTSRIYRRSLRQFHGTVTCS